MPNIRESAPQPGLGLNPTETGIESVAGAARRMGAYGNQIADTFNQRGNEAKSSIVDAGNAADNIVTHRQISAGAAEGTTLMAKATDAWDKIKGDPNIDVNDPTVAKKFMDGLEPAFDAFKENFNTERGGQFAEQFVERFRNQMSRDTTADMMTLAKIATTKNIVTTQNALGSMVANNPASLDDALETFRHTLDATVGSSPNLDGITKASVRTQMKLEGETAIVKAAVSSMITKNPNIDLDAIQKKYGEYINGAEMKMFAKAAQTQAKVDAYHDKSAQIAQRQLDDLNVHQSATDVITKNVKVDPSSGSPIVDPKFFNDALDIARKNPNAPSAAATVRTMLDWGESQLNKEKKPVDDPTAMKDLTDRLFDPNKPTTRLDLMKAQTAGKLSDHTFQSYERLVTELEKGPLQGPVWTDTIGAVKGELILSGVGLPGKDIAGEGNYAKWAQTFIPQYLAKSRDGTLPPNALDVKDPTSMISQSMAPFKRTVQQRTQDYLSVLTGAPAARNDTMSAIPPPDQRNAGSIYETPRGKMKWTGTGWVNP